MPAPHRRHRFKLDLEADSLAELVGVLHHLADQIEVEAGESRQIRHRGTAATFEARLRTDPAQDCQRYREQLGQWYRDQGNASLPLPRIPGDSQDLRLPSVPVHLLD